MKDSGSNTHARRAVNELRARIVNGALAGGTRLYEVSLAEDLEISRTPVREALSRLAEEGLLERLPNGGFAVRRFGLGDVVDSIEIRGVMEGMCARLAAERGVSPLRMDEIRAVVREMDECFDAEGEGVDFDRYAELNAQFHLLLSGLAESPMVAREVQRAASLPFASPSAFVPNHAQFQAFQRSLRAAQDQHKAILDAIANREGARAEAISREHARIARGNLEYIFTKDPEILGRMPGLGLIDI